MATNATTIPLSEKLKSIPGFFGIRFEEEAKYYVLLREGNMQIRRYIPFTLARTFVSGTFDYAVNEGFFRLTNYIFGGNASKQKIAMTVPVFQSKGKKLVMASPVLQEQHADGWAMSFIVPGKFKQESLPRPLEDNIEIVRVPAMVVASIRFRGKCDEVKMATKSAELLSWLQSKKDFLPVSEPRLAQYDAPFTIPFFRRNEIQITVHETEKRTPRSLLR